MKSLKIAVFSLTAATAFLAGWATTAHSAERFDYKVRNDFFAGFNGDKGALERGMKTTAGVLATEPNHAEALVWHGAGLLFQAGDYFRSGNGEKGMEFYGQGLKEMDHAVELAPKNIGVRIPRGATLLTSSRYMEGNPQVNELIQRGVSDYEAAYNLQKDSLDKMGNHPKGELLLGLGDGWSRLGNQEKARTYFELLAKELPGTPYEKRAATWMANKTLTPAEARCIGCHVSGDSK